MADQASQNRRSHINPSGILSSLRCYPPNGFLGDLRLVGCGQILGQVEDRGAWTVEDDARQRYTCDYRRVLCTGLEQGAAHVACLFQGPDH